MEVLDKQTILKELASNGFYILENYYTENQCDEILNHISAMPGYLFEQGQGGDLRCPNSQNYSNLITDFQTDSFIQGIANEYSDCNVARRCQLGVVGAKENTAVDSGGGWHFDKDEKQFKSFLYLTDVTEDNGPFTIIKNSAEAYKDVEWFSNNRISQETVDEYFNAEDIIKLTASKGTVILADTSFVHRGAEIKSGQRVTLTTYFYWD